MKNIHFKKDNKTINFQKLIWYNHLIEEVGIMKDAVLFVLLLFGLTILMALPIYACVNFALLVFHVNYHLTIWQAVALSLLLAIIKDPKDKGGN